MNQQNALITGTMFGREDHGIMTCFLHLEFGSGGCSFGGYAMDRWHEEDKKRVGAAFGMDLIVAILDTVGVDKWEDLRGKFVRVEHDGGLGGRIVRIGHITKDKWLDIEELVLKHKEASVCG